MSYTEGGFHDKNSLKRWLQRQRLLTAVAAAAREKASVRLVLDFGSGSGELCKLLVHEYPNATIICYEPCSDLLAEAKHELRGVPRIEFYAAFSDLPAASVDGLNRNRCSASRQVIASAWGSPLVSRTRQP